MSIIYRDMNGHEFEVQNDYFRSLHTLRSECNSYTVAEARYTEILAEHDKQVREEVIGFISDKLIYPLLDECDRRLWEHISYIELAEEWVKVLNDNPYPKVKNYRESRKRDLREWIAEQLKGVDAERGINNA